MCYLTDLMQEADNVYRTECYIVIQFVGINSSNEDDTVLVSRDVFIARTNKRDALYEAFQEGKKNIEGKRLPVAMYTRKYID